MTSTYTSARPPVRHKRQTGTNPGTVAAEDGALLRAIHTTFGGDGAIFDSISVIFKAPRHPALALALKPVLARYRPNEREMVSDRGLDRWANGLVGQVVDGVRLERDGSWFRSDLVEAAAA